MMYYAYIQSVKSSFKQVDVASSLSRTQASLVLHSFIATFTGSNITKYSGLNTVAKYMNRIFAKTLGRSLTGSSKRHKIQKGGQT